MRRTVVIMARDAGAAAALAPVARALLDDPARHATIVAYGKAAPTFEARGLATLALPEQPEPDRVVGFLERQGASALLTGTSMRTSRDGVFWAAARSAGIPSVALLDHWRNYAERFSERTPFDHLPDMVAVMDETAAREYHRAGCPPERVCVTGHPHLASVRPASAEERSRARADLGCAEGRPVVVFASEPIAAHYRTSRKAGGALLLDQENPLYLGYTERDALTSVAAALRAVAPEALLLMKLHPLEESDAFLDFGEDERPPETRVLQSCLPRTAIAAADLVTGMTSTFLLEAALMGVPALSVRPNGGYEHFLAVHERAVPSVLDQEAVAPAIAKALEGGRLADATLPGEGDPTARLISLLDDLSGDGPAHS